MLPGQQVSRARLSIGRCNLTSRVPVRAISAKYLRDVDKQIPNTRTRADGIRS